MRAVLPFIVAATILPLAVPSQSAETVALPVFHSMELRGGGDVTVVPGPVQRVTLVQGSSAITKFRVLSDGRLQIDACRMNCPHNYNLQIRVESPHVPDVAIAGGGNIR